MSAAAVLCGLALITPQDLIGLVDVGVGIYGAHDFEGVAVSPDRRHIAVETRRADLERNATIIRWHVIALDGDHRVIDVGEGGEPVSFVYKGLTNGYAPAQRPEWSSDSQWIVYRLKRAGQIQLWRSRADGSRQEQLTCNASDIESFRWSQDGGRIYFTVGETRDSIAAALKAEGHRGYLYDERFAPFYSRAPLRDTDDPRVRKPPTSVWVYDWLHGTERLATETERDEFTEFRHGIAVPGRDHARWVRKSENGNALVWLEDLRTDRSRGLNPPLTLVAATDGGTHNLGKGKVRGARICRAPECTGWFKGLWISDDTRTVYFLRRTGTFNHGPTTLGTWRIGSDQVRPVFSTPDLIEGCAKVEHRLICAHESATTPRKLVSLELDSRGSATATPTTIFDPNPGFAQFRFGPVTPLTWTTKGGIEGFGHFVLPPDAVPGRRYPLIIVQYRSRGFLRGGTGDEYPIHVFAANGFAVLSFDRPDDPELEASSVTAEDYEQKSWVDYRDRRRVLSALEAGIDLLDRQGLIDPARVGITGLSDGGETVAFALIHSPQRFAAAAASFTWWNPITYWLLGPKFQPEFTAYGFRDPDSDARAHWHGISIALNAERIRAPLLIQVSDRELLPETQAFAALRQHQKPVELHVFPDERHIKTQPQHRLHIYRRNLQWFQFWLQNIEAADPLDADQYARWRKLRSQISAVTHASSG